MPGAAAHAADAAHGLGYVEGVTHDYKRHGTTTLFAALNVLNGAVLAACKPRHRQQEFLSFLREIDKAVPAELDRLYEPWACAFTCPSRPRRMPRGRTASRRS